MDFIKRLPEPDRGGYASALQLLVDAQADDGSGPPGHAIVAHVDSGVAPHPGIGWAPGGPPPAWLLLDRGRNFLDGACDTPGAPPPGTDCRPIADMTRSGGLGDGLIEWPDHGVKTLSALCGNVPGRLVGVVPGVRVIPYRISNGPLFYSPMGVGPVSTRQATARLGWALDHLLGQPQVPGVVTMSMGNPGWLGPAYGPLVAALGGEVGIADNVAAAVNRCYEAGVILCCAAGQVIDSVIYPAFWERTVAVSGYDAQGTGGQCRHYPPGGYRHGSDRVDVHAQAMRINRAGFDFAAVPPAPEWAEDGDAGEPSGTSYATPQVAGAAALWRNFHNGRLEAMWGAPGERWRIVEAFRHALHASAKTMQADMRPPPGAGWSPIPTLDIPALLAMEPKADWPLHKRPPAA
ncbi:S8/S53 family peptidase [Albimonas sp. CAU 1670]|uniref:S8/S53 family peptidase n=1 Tax=Albimonas sp. CAU 1670 TaxID=3032599 RepID=UPI0023DB1750|nr:S8/S53 family peptidase [Albimonas sp. CAU 1670]MDF2234241.1 S8/S53 family peptidase [Albimonas sp. CAU 1670]